MAAKKKLKSSGEKAAQKERSIKNKARRKARQHKGTGVKSPAHVRHLLTNRLRRLIKNRKSDPKTFSDQQSARLLELQNLLKD